MSIPRVVFALVFAFTFFVGQASAATYTPTYTISGKITEATGQPLAGVNVQINKSTGFTSSVTTDIDGNYSQSGLDNGWYIVLPSKSGHTFTVNTGTILQQINNADISGKNFTATASSYFISGTVKDQSGQPLPGVKVQINDSAGFKSSSVTNVNGYYAQGGLKNAIYLVYPSKTGYTFSAVGGSPFQTISSANAIKDFIGKNPPPTAALTTPANGATYISPASITLSANASDTGGSIGKVEFFAGTNLIGTATVSPYSVVWTNVPTGTYTLTAKATDNGGAATVSPAVLVNVVDPLAIFTANLPNGSLNTAYSQGLVASGGVAPYTWSVITGSLPMGLVLDPLTGVMSGRPTSAGTNSFTIQVKDAANRVAQQTYTLTISSLAVTITSPLDGAQLDSDSALATGTYQGPPNTGITVNGQVACTDGAAFYANNLPLTVGTNAITANATSPSGMTASAQVNVTVSAQSLVAVSVSPACGGIAPHTATFTVSNNSGNTIQRIEADFDGNGAVDSVITDLNVPIQFTYGIPGTYLAKFAVTDSQGNVYHNTIAVVVTDVTSVDAMLKGVYTGMLEQLRVGNIEGALSTVTAGTYEKYKTVFNALGLNLPYVVDLLGTIQGGTIGGDMAEYVVVRNTPDGQQAFPVYFLKGEDGVWRIDGM